MRGELHVITGCMFAGKTEELLRLIRRLGYSKPCPSIWVFKSKKDTRSDKVETHYGEAIECEKLHHDEMIDRIAELLSLSGIRKGDTVCFDEYQFMQMHHITRLLLNKEVNVIISGLATDSLGCQFGSMPAALAEADKITHLTAICHVCGEDATKTQRLEEGGGQVNIGGADKYEARCRKCWVPR